MTTHMATATQSALTMVRKATARMVIKFGYRQSGQTHARGEVCSDVLRGCYTNTGAKRGKSKATRAAQAALVFLTSEKPFLLEKLYIVYVSGD